MLVGCDNKRNLLKNGLTKSASNINEIFISKNSVYDTLSIIDKRYDEKDNLIRRIQTTKIDNEKIETNYLYNNFGKIEKENVWMSYDSSEFQVNYIYQDSMLISTNSERVGRNFMHHSDYSYHSNNIIKKLVTKYTSIYDAIKDTIYIEEVIFYDKNSNKVRSFFKNSSHQKKNSSTFYKYKNKILHTTEEYNYKDSLVSVINYKYEFDSFSNWIRRESIENGKLKFVSTRYINYR